ncbi:TetR/AcrR family transcriptional regulator [Brachybacterium sp. GCM10030267]|uniref:TetR/AcrR family transcriptional regulator n=1 Tax=Brachybacterium sp. GCM10030267 TaxID=3273381 RepID=UPI00361BB4BF
MTSPSPSTTTETRPAHRPSAREAMLDAAEAHLGADGTLSLEAAARAAGVSKPGLMYHFATKEDLLAAVLDRIAERYEQEMLARITESGGQSAEDLAGVPARQRFLAYLQWSCQGSLSPADLVIFADPRLRVTLTERWQEQLDRWLVVPPETPADLRRRLLAVRLMADGVWFDRASGLLEIPADETASLEETAADLLGGES